MNSDEESIGFLEVIIKAGRRVLKEHETWSLTLGEQDLMNLISIQKLLSQARPASEVRHPTSDKINELAELIFEAIQPYITCEHDDCPPSGDYPGHNKVEYDVDSRGKAKLGQLLSEVSARLIQPKVGDELLDEIIDTVLDPIRDNDCCYSKVRDDVHVRLQKLLPHPKKVTGQCYYCEAKLIPTISKWGEQFKSSDLSSFNCPKCGARMKIQELSVEVEDE